ncbi:hypothetical protein AB4851_24765 [Burkholderia sp. 22PA0099]|uniref:hypothetical protein n=1 Tax=Burkholderia sp. 22PA0099 TaxID=3237372 RepID=UPI0039C07C36
MSESKRILKKSPPPTDPNASDCASFAPLYTLDHWENDPFLTRNPERAKLVEERKFVELKRRNVSPDEIADAGERDGYRLFLAKISR